MTVVETYQPLNVARLIAQLEWLAPSEWSLPEEDDDEPGDRKRKTPTQESAARAQLAALRRGLGKEPGEAPEVLPVIFPMLDGRRLDRRDQKIAFLIASLFASYPRPYRARDLPEFRENLGGSLRELQLSADRDDVDSAELTPATTAAESERSGPTPIERRLISLLDSRFDDLSEQLRGLVKLLAAKEIPLDWAQLTRNLGYWDHPDHYVQIRWAEAFWSEDRPTRATEDAEPGSSDQQE